jgi:Ni2+-binding GTPase involved in maturation of urease and hydrogenase
VRPGRAGQGGDPSVTEGECKQIKYPDMFRASQLMLLNEIDLLAHLRFDVAHQAGAPA